MVKILYYFIAMVGLVFMPVFYIAFNITGVRITFKELAKDYLEHVGSGEKLGVFDDGIDR